MSLKLPDMGYPYNALEPFIDSKTLEIHHKLHHASYLKKFLTAIKGSRLEGMEPEEIFINISEHPADIRKYGGGFFNHSLLWKIISPNGGGKPQDDLMDSIVKYFGTYEKFREEFTNEADKVFGSGWTWLIRKSDGELRITTTSNQDNPFMNVMRIRGKPILAIDLWEHAYHMQYHNNRDDYVKAFWNIINWHEVSRLYSKKDMQISWFELKA